MLLQNKRCAYLRGFAASTMSRDQVTRLGCASECLCPFPRLEKQDLRVVKSVGQKASRWEAAEPGRETKSAFRLWRLSWLPREGLSDNKRFKCQRACRCCHYRSPRMCVPSQTCPLLALASQPLAIHGAPSPTLSHEALSFWELQIRQRLRPAAGCSPKQWGDLGSEGLAGGVQWPAVRGQPS